jgi:hypothetical protein
MPKFEPMYEGDTGLYDEKFLEWWYSGGGMQSTILGLRTGDEKFKKAIGPWDAPTSPYAYYFEPVFSAEVYAYTWRATTFYKACRKTRFQVEGDSIKYWETDLAGLTGVGPTSTPFASGSAESAPTIATLEEFVPAYLVDPWETSLMSRTRAEWQKDPRLDPMWVRNYHTRNLPAQIEKQLTKTVDTVANDGSTYLDMESIDRLVSCDNEAATTYCAITDPDIYWGKSSVLIDRDGDTDNTFGGGGGAAGDGISLPSSAAARVLSLDYIDDVVTAIKKYSERKNYWGFAGPKTINEMQKLIDPKQRFLDAPMNVQYTLNGIQSRKGADTGFSVASYTAGGIRIPFLELEWAANEDSTNRSATITDADIGNIYIVDMDTVEIREAIPITYMETPPPAMMTGDVLKTRHWFLYAAQLLSTNFRANGAIKYLKST